MFAERVEKVGFAILDFGRSAGSRCCGVENGSPKKMWLAGTKDGALAYTEWQLEVQNGDSGLIRDGEMQVSALHPDGEALCAGSS